MSYINYMNQFWRLASLNPVPASEVALYAFLVNECNKRFWVMPFTCTSVYICDCLRISKQTLVTARKHLATLGLISFTEGTSRFQPSNYCLLELTDDLTVNKYKEKENIKEKFTKASYDSVTRKNQRRSVEVIHASAEDYEGPF